MTQARIAMFRDARAKARARGDTNMVRCMDVELSRLGVRDSEPRETVVAEVAAERPRRGRRAKSRCEHSNVPDRCVVCNPEENLAAVAAETPSEVA